MTHLHFPKIPLAVDGDRFEGVQNLLLESPGTEVIVLDDAYQHLSFRPSYHILLTEFEHPYFEDAPMPSGRLREFPCAAKDADTVIVTKVPDDAEVDVFFWRERLKLTPGQQLFFTRFRYEKPVAMTDAAKKIPLDEVSSGNLLTGIAHPKPLLAHLKKKYRIEKHFDFPDHHSYTVKDIESIYNQHFADNQKRCVLFTTEKDWMRLQSDHIRNIVSLLPVFVIPVEVEFLTDTQRDTFNQMLKDHVRRKKN